MTLVRTGRRALLRAGFTLVELLVVMGVMGVLIGLLLPAMKKAREQAASVQCASNLRSVGQGLLMYVSDHAGHLPYVVEPIWTPTGGTKFNVDPWAAPNSLVNVLSTAWKADASKTLVCRSAWLGYPGDNFQMTYRVSAANNYDGQAKTLDQLTLPDGTLLYTYSLKFLNGRKYKLIYANPNEFPLKLVKGVGPFYVARDFVSKTPNPKNPVQMFPHGKAYNQLKLDMSVSREKEVEMSFYP